MQLEQKTHNWTHFGPTGWPRGQRVHFVFLFYFSFVYVRWSSSSRAARLAAETRRQFEWMRWEEKYTFFFVLFLPTPVRIAGPFQKFILNIFQAVDLFKTFAT
jgi:hypothetical protein